MLESSICSQSTSHGPWLLVCSGIMIDVFLTECVELVTDLVVEVRDVQPLFPIDQGFRQIWYLMEHEVELLDLPTKILSVSVVRLCAWQWALAPTDRFEQLWMPLRKSKSDHTADVVT